MISYSAWKHQVFNLISPSHEMMILPRALRGCSLLLRLGETKTVLVIMLS